MQLPVTLTSLLALLFTVVNSQYVIHQQQQNITVINTTYVQPPSYGFIPPHSPPGQMGFVRNVSGYQQPGYMNNQTGGKRNGNDLLVGNPGPNDTILFKEWFNKGPRWMQTREKVIEYPIYPTANSYKTITAVHIIDISNKPGGQANIVSGGVGFRTVSIKLFSNRSAGFNYKVVIYGR